MFSQKLKAAKETGKNPNLVYIPSSISSLLIESAENPKQSHTTTRFPPILARLNLVCGSPTQLFSIKKREQTDRL